MSNSPVTCQPSRTKRKRQSLSLVLHILASFSACISLSTCGGSFSLGSETAQPAVSFSAGSLNFGSQNLGTTSASQTVTLTNTGTATLTLSSITIVDANSTDFAETNTCTSSLNPNAHCSISVTFTPTVAGTRTAAVAITDNASGSPQTIALTGTGASSTSTGNTPLVDFTTGQKYLGTYPGFLYTDPATGTNSNTVPTVHDSDGKAIAAQIVPLDANGKPSATGKIVVIGIGMSNWTDELCQNQTGPCLSFTFFGQAASSPNVNHTTLVLVDCAQGGHDADDWIDDSVSSYATCLSLLAAHSVTAQQVQVVLWKNADGGPTVSLTSSTICQPQPLPIPPTNPDACSYEQYMGLMARFLKTQFPNVKQLFVHSRVYAGYATTTLNPEPFAYEYGFATKWFVNTQIVQIANGTVDSVAGNLNYTNGTAPWIAWGPYWWAAGTTPCNNCQLPGQIWLASDFQADGTHPSQSGATKVANNLMNFYLNSPYSPWFRP